MVQVPALAGLLIDSVLVGPSDSYCGHHQIQPGALTCRSASPLPPPSVIVTVVAFDGTLNVIVLVEPVAPLRFGHVCVLPGGGGGGGSPPPPVDVALSVTPLKAA